MVRWFRRFWCRWIHTKYHAWYTMGPKKPEWADCHLCGEDRIKVEKSKIKVIKLIGGSSADHVSELLAERREL